MDPVKDAFDKVKQDIEFLKYEFNNLREEIGETRKRMIEICEIVKKIDEKVEFKDSTHNLKTQTNPLASSTHNSSLEALKPQYLPISTGNEGASTDRQTDRQTHRQTQKEPQNKENSFENALEILNSLDNIKKEVRLKFKRLTEQEILIFSTIYQIEEEKGYTNYKQIAEKLDLTESSVRDYVGRLIKKNIPIEKKKVNNKQIQLFISQNLKKIAPLSTILQLRDL
ncbi:response regulator transcription factor [Candidatus Pacearchaeota archaeon]|nr:response regulator transcription factor [Candidatus Pacearchaeota archaeon]